MRIRYSISQWNFTHYTRIPELEELLPLIRQQGYGVELWPRCHDEEDLFGPIGVRRVKPLVEGMDVSLHTAGGNGLDLHKKQIDAAAELGGEVIVLHPPGIAFKDNPHEVDPDLANQAVEYAEKCGVKLALENGSLEFLTSAIDQTEGLGICLDVGHVYNIGGSMADFLDGLKGRLIHLHLQDICAPADSELPLAYKDHYTPGTGGIPRGDWELFAATLKEIDFDGIAVFEVRPQSPFQTAPASKGFFESLAGS